MGQDKARIEIATGEYVKGDAALPKPKERDVLQWLEKYRDDMMGRLQNGTGTWQHPTAILGGVKMRQIVKARIMPTLDGWLLCEFDNGEKRFVDIKPSMYGVLEKLRDPDFFNQVYVDEDAGTVAWPEELHLDPDTLYSRGIDAKVIENLWNALLKEKQQGDWLERA